MKKKNTNSTKIKDPHAKREAKKYDSPIPSREYITQILEESGAPVTHRHLCGVLGLDDEDAIEALRRRLLAMERDGQVVCNRKGAYGPIDKMDLVKGRVQGHRDGFGFVIPSEGGDDFYLSSRQMRRVFDGDEVLVRLAGIDRRGRKEAAIVDVLQRNTDQIVGRYVRERGIHFVAPDNQRIVQEIIISEGKTLGAKEGQFVTARITEQPSQRGRPIGEIIEILGDHMAPGMEIDVAIRAHDIPNSWPAAVDSEARLLADEVVEEDKVKRVDLRELPFVTIDGEDARDFDDAVYCEKKKSGGWRLFVAIADVSHYVGVHSALDAEAIKRGTSVYFPDHVVPMLPEKISNGLCSLKPFVDRLCMVCEMSISATGKVSRYKFYEGVMHSHARLTYTQVGNVLSPEDKTIADTLANAPQYPDSATPQQLEAVSPQLRELHALYKVLRLARDKRGAIDFDTVETRILFDENRKISQIVPVTRNDAHKLIEECMLSANVCAARFLETQGIDCLYRVHEGPNGEKLLNLRKFLGGSRLDLPGGDKPNPTHYQTLLQSIGDRPDAHIIQTMMLRSLSQAVYYPENKGHFGLHYKAYAHFTSPIRRYPDLLVHRALRHVIRSRQESIHVERVKGAKVIAKKQIYPYDLKDIVTFGEQASLTERRADDATRDVVRWLKCEYLQERVGEEFEGRVTAVTAFGLFVELCDIYVEGLVHISALHGDYYHFDPVHMSLKGERTGASFRLGDLLDVKVVRVDLDEKKIDFELVGISKSKKGQREKSHSKKSRVNDGVRVDDDSSAQKGKNKKQKVKKLKGKKSKNSKAKVKRNDAGKQDAAKKKTKKPAKKVTNNLKAKSDDSKKSGTMTAHEKLKKLPKVRRKKQ